MVSTSGPVSRRSLGRRFGIGLRARVTISFGLLALGLSALLTISVWLQVSHFLVDERQSVAVNETRINAAALQRGVAEGVADVPRALDAVVSGSDSSAIVSYDGSWYATSFGEGPSSLPKHLVADVQDGTPSRQKIRLDGRPVLAIGVPMDRPGDAYFGVYDLSELNSTFQTLSGVLVATAIVIALIGLLLGRVASSRALQPLAELTRVASTVARGDLGSRMHGISDPDLSPLASSFNSTVDALERRVRADTRFAGEVSHELRTPLTTMLNSMQLLQNRRDKFPADVLEPLDLLAGDLERFRRLVVDLLEMSRADVGDVTSTESVMIGELVSQAADAAAGRRVTSVEPDVALLRIRADKRRLERVIANLVENAEVHAGGCEQVTVERGTHDTVRIVVDDAGPGVSPEDRERIFERFSRASDATHPGVGLGLAIVARHVRWHHGSVSVVARQGGGARFIVVLPSRGG